MLCIFFMSVGIRKISRMLSADLTLPFGGDAVVMIQVSESEDGLQANRSVFLLHVMLSLTQ